MMKAAKLSLSLAVVCLLVAFGVSSAQADQIVYGPSTQAVTFTNTSSSTLSLALGTTVAPGAGCVASELCLSGSAHTGVITTTSTGTFAISTPTSPLLTVNTPPVNLNEFLITGTTTSTFEYDGSNNNTLKGTITWAFVADGTANPSLHGTILISSVGTGSAVAGSYTVGEQAETDFTLNGISPSVDNLFKATLGSTTGNTISSGEVATPEPASLALFGTGLLGFAFLLRRKKLFA